MAWFVEIRFPRLWMPVALYLPLAGIMAAISLRLHPRSMTEILALLAIGVFAWTLIEYVLHRYVFHEIPWPHPWNQLTSGFHLSHHRAVAAKEPDIVITRPAGSLPFALIFFFLFSLLSWSFSRAALIETGTFLGYLAYEAVHYWVHHSQAKSRLGRSLQRYHLQHHHRFPEQRFGVTSPLWDLVFGTYRSSTPH